MSKNSKHSVFECLRDSGITSKEHYGFDKLRTAFVLKEHYGFDKWRTGGFDDVGQFFLFLKRVPERSALFEVGQCINNV
ncbi:hypothetical protein CEXT_530151 [Caerostris extrusa]|uniref:Uncharacterized protein n=1 Tax=Caerostris extrusa TaxID=172846 RepID=A0AAV4XCL1_CAEEX|nr:hypothetical protein CEXT_530151 [Caerostris extrusa]